MKTLYPFQTTGVEFLASRQKALLADDQGLGKTIQAIAAAKQLKARKILIVCPAVVKYVWHREITAWLGEADIQVVEGMFARVKDSAITIINYDLLASPVVYEQIISRLYSVGIFDECFHEDTVVRTKRGSKKIRDVVQGDYILNCSGWDRVSGVYVKKLDQCLKIRYGGAEVFVSTEHPFLTAEGWKKAGQLKKGEYLVKTTYAQKVVSSVPKKDSKNATESVLRDVLLREMAYGTTGNIQQSPQSGSQGESQSFYEADVGRKNGSGEKTSGSVVAQNIQKTGQVAFTKNKQDSPACKVETDCAGREWPGTSDTAEQIIKTARKTLDTRTPDTDKSLENGVSEVLQTRPGLAVQETRNRDRRGQPPLSQNQKERRKKREKIDFVRVENIEVFQLRSNGLPGKGIGSNIFVDLKMTNHPSFSINGALVHNCHYLKGRDTKRTKAVLLRGGVASRCLYKWFMTGTPVLNRPVELYPLLKACAPELLGEYSSFNAFAHRYCGAYFDGYDLNVRGHSNVDELNEKLTRSGFMLRRLKSEVLHELPEKQYQIIPLGKEGIKNSKAFRFLKSDARKQTPSSLDGGDLATERRELALAKLPYARDHVRSLLESERKIVVFAYHREVLEYLQKDLLEYNPGLVYGGVSAVKRDQIVQDFRTKPECRLFLGQITAAGVGITLVEARTAVFAEISWVPGEIFQAVDRIHRIGQKEKVLIQFMVWENTLEEFMLRSVIDKKHVVEAIVEQKDEEEIFK